MLDLAGGLPDAVFACVGGGSNAIGLFYPMIGDEGIDLAVLPIGDNYTMGPGDALRAVKLLRPKRVIPIHYNTWDLIAQDPISWAEAVRTETKAEVVLLSAGESFEL